MSQTYYTLVTNLGAALLAQATTLGTKLKLTHVAVGDGNGNLPSPSVTQKKLVNEKRRGAINAIYVDSDNANQIIIEQVIPPEEGGFYIREIGLFDENNNLIAVGNCPPSYKPILSEGSGRTQVINMVIIVDNTGSVQLKIDASSVVATRKYVDDLITTKMKTHEESINHPTATTSKKGMVQLDSSTNSTAEDKAATPQAVNNVYKLANAALPKVGNVHKYNDDETMLAFFRKGMSDIYRNEYTTSYCSAYSASLLLTAGDTYSSLNFPYAGSPPKITVGNKSGGSTYTYSLVTTKNLDTQLKNNSIVIFKGDWGIGEPNLNRLENIKDDLASNKGTQFLGKTPSNKANSTSLGAVNGYGFVGMLLPYRTTSAQYYATRILLTPDKYGAVNGIPTMYLQYMVGENGWKEPIEVVTTANISAHLPIGIPQPWPTTTVPSGWLKCNGATFDKTLYPKLAIAYPSGKLPDLRGEFIRGFDDGRGIDSGRTILSNQTQQITKHKHIAPYAENINSTNNIFGNSKSNAYHGSNGTDKDNNYFYTNDGSNDTDWPDLNIDGLIGSETRPRNISFLYIVKAE